MIGSGIPERRFVYRVTSLARLLHSFVLPTGLLFGLLLFTSLFAYPVDSRSPRLSSRAALQRAADLVQQGRLEEADRQAHLALADSQTRAGACSVLGTIRLQQKRVRESIKFFQEAIRLEPRLLGARLSLAEAYSVQGEDASAIAMYHRVLEMDSTNASARFALARYEGEKGNFRQSLELAKPILPELKKSPDGLMLLMSDYLGAGEHAAAADLSKDWIHLAGVPADWSIKFALSLAKGGHASEAIDVLENAARSEPRTYELAFNLAGLYVLNNNPTLALKEYDLALEAEPDSIAALRQAAVIAERENHLERSLSYWMRAKKIQPDDPETLLGFGRLCLKMDLLDDAETALTKAASLRPEDPVFLYTLGSAQVGKKQFEAAQSVFQKLLKKKPQDSQFQYALGSVFYLEGRLSEAAAHLEESIRLQPDQLASYYYLALVVRDEGKDADAIERLQALLQRYPDHAPSREALGELLMNTKKYPEAESNLKRAIELDPQSVKANYQLGLLLARLGRKEDADKQMAIAKSLRTADASDSRLQLRLLDSN